MKPSMYSHRCVEFEDCAAMSAAAVQSMDDNSVFRATKVIIKSNNALKGLAGSVLIRQRDAIINGHEPLAISSSEVPPYCTDDGLSVPWTERPLRPAQLRDMDRNAAHLLETIGLRPSALAEIGLVVCGGCLVESTLVDSPLDREHAQFLLEKTGFDIDLFVTGDVPYKGSVMAYARALEAHVSEHQDYMSCDMTRRGFCVDVMVNYIDATSVKMQIIDLGVPASPIQIVSSFDISVTKMFWCATTARIMMTEDAAYSLANSVILYDRRFVEDLRYPQRLRKYVDRTGFGLVLDDLGVACARVAYHVAQRLVRAVASAPMCDILSSWLEELGTSDTSVLVQSMLGQHIGKGSCRGYGSKKRVPECCPLTGVCGRFGVRQVARRGDALTELHAMYLLSKATRNLALYLSPPVGLVQE